MALTIELLPAQEQQIQEEAEREGVSVSEVVQRTLDARFPAANSAINGASNHEIMERIARWEREDALASDEERAEDARIYTEIERNGIARVQI